MSRQREISNTIKSLAVQANLLTVSRALIDYSKAEVWLVAGEADRQFQVE